MMPVDRGEVEIKLPGKPFRVKTKIGEGNDDIEIVSTRRSRRGNLPSGFLVKTVQLVLLPATPENVSTVDSPSEHLASDNYRKAARLRMSNRREEYEACLEQAYSEWKYLFSYLTGKFAISNPYARNSRGGGGTYIIDIETRRPIFPTVLYLEGTVYTEVTKRQWNMVQRELSRNRSLEIWEKYYVDAEHRRQIRDYVGAILSLAISIESAMRRLIERFISDAATDEFEKMVNRMNLSQFIDKWKSLGFSSRSWERAFNKKKIKSVIDLRNRIMHGGERFELDAQEIDILFKATLLFLRQVERAA